MTSAATIFQLICIINVLSQDFLLNSTVLYVTHISIISFICQLDRADELCSTDLNLANEIENIRKYFGQNGYPFNMVEKCIKTKLDSLFIPSIPNTDVPL